MKTLRIMLYVASLILCIITGIIITSLHKIKPSPKQQLLIDRLKQANVYDNFDVIWVAEDDATGKQALLNLAHR